MLLQKHPYRHHLRRLRSNYRRIRLQRIQRRKSWLIPLRDLNGLALNDVPGEGRNGLGKRCIDAVHCIHLAYILTCFVAL